MKSKKGVFILYLLQPILWNNNEAKGLMIMITCFYGLGNHHLWWKKPLRQSDCCGRKQIPHALFRDHVLQERLHQDVYKVKSSAMWYKLVLVLAEVLRSAERGISKLLHFRLFYFLPPSFTYIKTSSTLDIWYHILTLYTFLSCHLINSENRSPLYLLGETSHCILPVMSHYDSLNQLSSLVWIFLVSHLEYLMSLIALTLAFSLSDVTQRTSRFSFDNAYVIMSLLWFARWNLGSHVESNEVSGVQGTKAGERRLGQIRVYLISHPILEH